VSVAVDAMVIIWGMKGAAKKGKPVSTHAAEMQHRAKLLLFKLAEKKETIIIPAVTVAEVLYGLPADTHGTFLATLESRFFCPPFDVRACALAAALWQQHRGLPAGEQMDRTVLKNDVMVVATAKVAGAEAFYSHDRKCRDLAALAGLKAHDLPTHSENYLDEMALGEEE
jgi:predicted nucleic acid-binding protein